MKVFIELKRDWRDLTYYISSIATDVKFIFAIFEVIRSLRDMFVRFGGHIVNSKEYHKVKSDAGKKLLTKKKKNEIR